MVLPLLLVSALIVALTATFIVRDFQSGRERARAELRSVADLRQTQIETWLHERLSLARFLAGDAPLAELYMRWRQRGDADALAQLLARAIELRKANGSDGVLVLDEQGQAAAREFAANREVAAPLRERAQRALASGEVLHTGIYQRDGTVPPLRLDIVLPLNATGRPARAALAFRIDPRQQLYPTLRAWPVPSNSGETVLWQRDGEEVRALSETRHGDEAATRLTRPLKDVSPALLRVLRGEVPTLPPAIGADYRGERVMATVRAVAGTDWVLVSKLDLSEIDAPAWAAARWAGGLSALALFGLLAGARLFMQRAALRQSDFESAEQRKRLQTLQLLQAITDSSGDAIFAKDLQGKYIFFNRVGGESIGRPAEEVLGLDDHELFSPEVAAQLRGHDAEVLRSETRQTFEEQLPTPNGPLIQLSTKGPLRDADGRVVGLFGVSRDITEHRRLIDELEAHRHHLLELVEARTQALQQANAQIGEAERFLRLVADNLPGCIAYWDRDSYCRFVNRGYYDWFGLTPEQTLGKHVAEIHGPEYHEMARGRFERALAGEAQLFERETRRGSELTHHLVHYVPDQRSDGQVHGVHVLALDVSPLKRAEGALQRLNGELVQARDRAEAANRSKSAFLANMSHEIRTPMNAIIGLAHLMQRDTRDALQRDRLEKVSSSARHLLQVINDILDLSKIEAGRLELEDIEFSLDVLLSRTFEMVAATADAKGLELVVDTDHLPDAMRGDPTRLSQALLNLLANAVKFTERGWVKLFGELIGEDGDRVQVRFAVHDSGVGIPADRIGSLFNAFEQVDSSTSRRHGGTGLGLALTRRLAMLMGGESGVESEPGVGSRFWFTAWLSRGVDGAAPGAAAAPALSGRRVLLVDDLPEARSALSDRLHQFGMRVDAVESGERALAVAQRALDAGEIYDVLLIDWQMAPLDGIQTLQHLHSLLGEGLPPAVLVTAHDDDRVRRQAVAARFSAVLVKPITASTLHDTLVRTLRRESPPLLAAVLPGVAESALRDARSGTRVLLVEDNPINQEVALELLRSAGLAPDLAADGHQAVEMALREPYAAVLMDMQMPGMDGLEAARELRQRGFAAPIIAMTANAFGEDRAACLAAGMNDHVAKPVDPEAVYATLLRWLVPNPAAVAPAALPPAPPSLQSRLADLPGLDYELGLRSAGGRPDVLERLLHRFAEHYAKGQPLLLQPGGNERIAAWRQIAHSLQGACGAVGASGLHDRARRLELAARSASAAETLEADAVQLHAAVQALAASLARALASA